MGVQYWEGLDGLGLVQVGPLYKYIFALGFIGL